MCLTDYKTLSQLWLQKSQYSDQLTVHKQSYAMYEYIEYNKCYTLNC